MSNGEMFSGAIITLLGVGAGASIGLLVAKHQRKLDQGQRLKEQRLRVMAAAQALPGEISVSYLIDPDLPENPRAVFHRWRGTGPAVGESRLRLLACIVLDSHRRKIVFPLLVEEGNSSFG